MTREELANLKEGQIVEYKRYWPSADKYSTERGRFYRVHNDGENAIIGNRGMTMMIHYSQIVSVKESFYDQK